MGEISITTLGLIIGLGVVGMCGILICMACRNKKDWKTIDLRAPLIQDAPSRVDEALAVAQHGSSKCTACGFDNFSHVDLCVVCGDAVGDDATRKKTIKRRKKILPPETYAVRAERAKRRGEWVRKTDVQGKIYWFRGPVSDPTHQPIEAAHTVHFDGANNYVPGKTLDAVPGLSVRWVDPTTADADAAAFPVGAALLGAATPLLALADQPFPTRYAEFVQRASALASPSGRVRLRIRDATKPAVFQQAVRQLLALSPEDLRGQILIRLDNGSALAGSTEAVDWHRDWLASLSDTLADPATGLFTCVNRVDQTYFLNADSRAVLGDDHLDYFFAVGRLLGHVLVQGDLLGFHLAPPLLKILLGRPLGFHDLEHFDPETYRSLRSLLSATATDVDALALDFSVHERRGDTLETIDLVPNGRNVRVTDATKHDFLTRKTQRVLVESVADQLAALCRGFYDVVPHELLMLLQDAEELDYVLCGADEIDVDEWERESKYNQYLFDHPALKFFWRVVRGLPEDYKRRLLHYATGSTRVPLGGFAALKSFDGRLAPFSLHSAELVDTELVRSQPCLNKLTLPLYVSEKKLRTHLLAILDPEIYEFAIAKQ